MEKTIEELHNHVIELASYVENKGIDGQQKLIIAAAMMTVVKSVYLDHFITNLSREWRNGKYIDDGKNKWKTGFSTNDENINIYLRCWKYFVEKAAIKCNEETKKI